MKLNHMAGASIQVELGGVSYTLSPIRLGELAILEKWLEDRPVARLMEMLGTHGAALPQETKDKLLADEIARSSRVCILEGVSWARIHSIEGAQMFLWLSIRQKHPEIKLEQIATMVSASALTEIQNKLDEVSGLLDKVETPASGEAPGEKLNPSTGLGSTEPLPSNTVSPQKS